MSNHAAPDGSRNIAIIATDRATTRILRDTGPALEESGRSGRILFCDSLALDSASDGVPDIRGAGRWTASGDNASWEMLRSDRGRLTDKFEYLSDLAARMGVERPTVVVLMSEDLPGFLALSEALTSFQAQMPDSTILLLVVGGTGKRSSRSGDNAAVIAALQRDAVISVALWLDRLANEANGPLVEHRAILTALLHLLVPRRIPSLPEAFQLNLADFLADLGQRGPWVTLQVASASVPAGPAHPLIRGLQPALRMLASFGRSRPSWSGREVFRTLPPQSWGGHPSVPLIQRAVGASATVRSGLAGPRLVALPLAPRDRRWPRVAEELTRLLAQDGADQVILVSGNGAAAAGARAPFLVQVTTFASHQGLPDLSRPEEAVHRAAPVEQDAVTANGRGSGELLPVA